MFSEELEKISWEETTERIAQMTDTDVRRALAKDRCDRQDHKHAHKYGKFVFLHIGTSFPSGDL